jgi:hypothetical protein
MSSSSLEYSSSKGPMDSAKALEARTLQAARERAGTLIVKKA